eukprot:7729696-Pyramimonas_sp.AAC.1
MAARKPHCRTRTTGFLAEEKQWARMWAHAGTGRRKTCQGWDAAPSWTQHWQHVATSQIAARSSMSTVDARAQPC